MLLVGPLGFGKTMLGKRLPTLLPPLSFEEALEATKFYSIAPGARPPPLSASRPHPLVPPRHPSAASRSLGVPWVPGQTPRRRRRVPGGSPASPPARRFRFPAP
jgi:magnesium chelatase family protein